MILFNAQMHVTVNTGIYRIPNLRLELFIFQHSKWIRWLQGIVKRWVMKMCTVVLFLMIRYGCEFCKKLQAGRQNVHVFQNDTDGTRFQS